MSPISKPPHRGPVIPRFRFHAKLIILAVPRSTTKMPLPCILGIQTRFSRGLFIPLLRPPYPRVLLALDYEGTKDGQTSAEQPGNSQMHSGCRPMNSLTTYPRDIAPTPIAQSEAVSSLCKSGERPRSYITSPGFRKKTQIDDYILV